MELQNLEAGQPGQESLLSPAERLAIQARPGKARQEARAASNLSEVRRGRAEL